MEKKQKKTLQKSISDKPDNKTTRYKQFDGDGRPAWRFSTVDKGGEFKWPRGENTELEILTKLHHFDSMLWTDFQGDRNHFINPDSLSKNALKRLNELEMEDMIENLFSIALSGKERIIMIRQGDLAKMLWYDPNHQVCPVFKKHT